jgi:transcriptional regulator with XRE-family HTH domain
LRQRKGLSQEELAHQAGIDRAHVSKLENGVKMPSWEIVTRLVRPLGVSFTEFAAEFESNLRHCHKT